MQLSVKQGCYAEPNIPAITVLDGQDTDIGTVAARFVEMSGTARGTMRWTMNGTTVTATSVLLKMYGGGTFTIIATAPNGNLELRISENPAFSLGPFPLLPVQPPTPSTITTSRACFSLPGYNIPSYGNSWLTTLLGSSGNIALTRLDLSRLALTGTFAFNATFFGSTNVPNIDITDGSFDLRL